MKRNFKFIILLLIFSAFIITSCDTHKHSFDIKCTTIDTLASDATCQSKAKYYYSCECGKIGTDTFEAGNLKEHVFSNEFTSDDNNHFYKCNTCDEKKEINNHDYGRMVITTYPTVDKDGFGERICQYCDHKQVETIKKLSESISIFEFNSVVVYYTGETYSIFVTNLFDDVYVVYEGNGVSLVGEHNVTAKIYSTNNVLLGSLTATITIVEYDVVLPPTE